MRVSPVLWALALATTAASASVRQRASDNTESAPSSGDFIPGAYIVELDGDDGPDSFYQTLSAEDGVDVDHRMDFNHRFFKGASFSVRNHEAGHDKKLFMRQVQAKPKVKNVWPVRIVRLNVPEAKAGEQPQNAKNTEQSAKREMVKRQTTENVTDTFSPHVMTKVSELHAKGVTGKGFRIAIVDSGVDYKHPALGGCFGPGCLVETGYDFTGDDYLPTNGKPPKPDDDPYDNCVGHGTHVAGIIAAQPETSEYGVSGAAPGVKIAAYRAWGCRATSTVEILMNAFMRAFDDGADMISCSDGDVSGWPHEAWALVASRIVDAGVPVIVSEGNDGGFGLFYASSPAVGNGVAGAGAISNIHLPILFSAASFSVGSDNSTSEPFGFIRGSPGFATEVQLELWSVGNDTNSTSDACSPLPDSTPDLGNKLVLLRFPERSSCFPIDQGDNIAAKGGKYVAYYAQNNLTIDESFLYVDGIEGVITVAPYPGAQWIEALQQGKKITVSIPDANSTGIRLEELEDNLSGGYMGDFSSWGPTWELQASPQLSAPGASILSTYPMDLGGYRVMTGTSMSCPMIAAAYALVGEVKGIKDPKTLGSLLSATAKPLNWFDRTRSYSDIIAPVPQQGAGIIQVFDAAYSNTLLSEDSISFNDTDHFAESRTFSIQNTGAEDATFELGQVDAATMYTFIPNHPILRASSFPNTIVEGSAKLSFSQDSVTIAAGQSANITVTCTPPAGLNDTLLPIYSGFITLKSASESLVLPYLGLAGSLKSTPVLQESQVFLADFNSPQPANKTFTIPHPQAGLTDTSAIYPTVLIQPTVGTSLLRVDVFSPSSNTTSHPSPMDASGTPVTGALGSLPGFPMHFIPRTSVSAEFKGALADGTVVEAGAYQIVVSALRIFGDVEKVGDWDVVETVGFNLQYSS